MLARRVIPDQYREWNMKWGAPLGYPPRMAQRFWGRLLPANVKTKLAGPFSIQPNSQTREYEYPWAYHAVPLTKNMRVVDVGGGLAGFQFVLSSACDSVVNVDPGLAAEGRGWKCDPESLRSLNRMFGASVELRNCTMRDAGLEKNSYDVVYSISVMEHLVEEEFWETSRLVWECLKPGGKFVVSVDLFLNLYPFSSRKSNEYGSNFPVGKLTECKTFLLASGNPQEIYGSDEFDKEYILGNLEEYYVGGYPSMAQCLILEKS